MVVGRVRQQIYAAASQARGNMSTLTAEATQTLNEVEQAAKLMQAATQDMKASLLEIFAEVLEAVEEVNDGFKVEVKIPDVAKQTGGLMFGGDLQADVFVKLKEPEDDQD